MDDYNFVQTQQTGGAAAAAATPTRHQVLQKYTNTLRHLRNIAEQTYRVRPFYFDNYVLWQYFQQRSTMDSIEGDIDLSGYRTPAPLAFLKLELFNHILDRRRQILYWIFYLLLVSLCVFAYRQHDDNKLSIGNSNPEQDVQSFAYPSMRMWRRITLPLIQRFPRLTELYDESCLMQNPFFQGVEDLSCTPCANVQNVLDLTVDSTSELDGHASARAHELPSEFVPFVFKINQEPIQLNDFYNIYASNHEIFQRDAYRVQSTNRDVTNLEELFNKFNHTQYHEEQQQHQQRKQQIPSSEAHNIWRCNRMLPARLLRKLFVSPTLRLPRTGIALERYLAIDTAQAPAYTLPDTECANVYVQQALGTRYIFLRPTSECRHQCRTLSLRLPQSFVLSYNWWYWKPISAPDPISDTFSITLIGSYC